MSTDCCALSEHQLRCSIVLPKLPAMVTNEPSHRRPSDSRSQRSRCPNQNLVKATLDHCRPPSQDEKPIAPASSSTNLAYTRW
ncbi:hypothetical protein ACLOJK_006979 [Asimina triloba]